MSVVHAGRRIRSRLLVTSLCGALALALPGCNDALSDRPDATSAQAPDVVPLTIRTSDGKQHVYRVEVARTGEQQQRGLMYRRELDRDAGMIFPMVPPRRASFWMANTYIPLDIIFIRADGTIERIASETQPESLTPIESYGPVAAVLELNGGEAARAGIKPGDRVEYAL